MRGSTLKCAALGFGLCLLPLAGCGKNGEPPAIETQKDAKGDTHIAIHNEQIKRDLNQAGRELKDNARNLGQQIREGARQIDQSDTAVTTRVKARLIAAPDLGGVHIDVNTVDGRVTLTGKVATADRRADAEKIAARTAGVKSVDNQLTVAPNG
jgi:osmotically-inducible protein OsmY